MFLYSGSTRELIHSIMVCIFIFLGLFCFFNGFLPLKLPKTTASLEPVCLLKDCKPVTSRAILIVIDALKSGFIYDDNSCPANWPYLCRLKRGGKGHFYSSKVHPPTVTLPRVKALTTGDIPGFVDVLLNYNSSELVSDNLIAQLHKLNKSVVFYGDDTWLKLFPYQFKRYDGTTSFYVSDYTEVDYNVTRHLESELSRTDWSMMILHYLGLDHIGHLIGPFSELVPPKLREMDAIIERVHKHYLKQDAGTDSNTLIIITGDHGMADQGGHGGVSYNEVTTPVIILDTGSRLLSDPTLNPAEIYQIDLVSTLSALLSLPIPYSNLGVIIPALITALTQSNYSAVDALIYNTEQITTLLSQDDTTFRNGALYNKFSLLKSQYSSINHTSDTDRIFRLQSSLKQVITDMREVQASRLVEYDLHAMMFGLIVICMVCLSRLLPHIFSSLHPLSSHVFIVLYIIWLYSRFISCTDNSQSNICRSELAFFTPLIGTMLVLVNAVYSQTSDKVQLVSKYRLIFTSTVVLHSLSYLSSSYIEEEHQTVYFISTTFLILLFIRSYRCRYKLDQILILLSLAIMCVLRKWNQTGDKWSHLTDIADLLSGSDYERLKLMMLIPSHLLIHRMIKSKVDTQHNTINILISAGCILGSCCTYYQSDPYYRSLFGMLVYYIIFLFIFISIYQGSLSYLYTAWVTLSILLHRSCNIPMYAGLLLVEHFISQINIDKQHKMILYYWMGAASYFYQGNSNNMNTIDVAAGYKGLSFYNPVITGFLLACNTYSSQIIWFISACLSTTGNLTDKVRCTEMVDVLLLYKLTDMSVLLTLIIIERYHLFVWTVFAPKLLYELFYMSLILVLYFISHLHQNLR